MWAWRIALEPSKATTWPWSLESSSSWYLLKNMINCQWHSGGGALAASLPKHAVPPLRCATASKDPCSLWSNRRSRTSIAHKKQEHSERSCGILRHYAGSCQNLEYSAKITQTAIHVPLLLLSQGFPRFVLYSWKCLQCTIYITISPKSLYPSVWKLSKSIGLQKLAPLTHTG